MKKIFLFLAITVSLLFFAQNEQYKIPKQDLFFTFDTQIGFNLADILRKKETFSDENPLLEKTYFTYGFSAYLGYNFVPRFSFATGLKYNYITNDIHPIYWVFQPRYYFNVDSDEPVYLGIYYGKKVNKTTVVQANVFGVNAGVFHPITSFSNLSFSGFLELHSLNSDPSWFLGVNFGINIFTGANNY